MLAFPDPTRSFILDTDASDVGVGAVLSQKGEHGEQVIGYFSRALSRPERNYCVTRRELLALVLGIKNFRTYLYGKKFLLRTDHAALTWLLNFREPEGQLARWLETLQDYDFNIQHRAGKLHGNADALSRRPCVTTECRQCERHEKKSTATAETTHDQHPREADVRTANTADAAPATDNEWEVFDRQQLQQMQEQDPVLTRLRSWVGEGQRPPWSAVSALDPETKTLYSQWPNFTIREGLLYRRWQKTIWTARDTTAAGASLCAWPGATDEPRRGGDRTLWHLKDITPTPVTVLLAGLPPRHRAIRALL